MYTACFSLILRSKSVLLCKVLFTSVNTFFFRIEIARRRRKILVYQEEKVNDLGKTALCKCKIKINSVVMVRSSKKKQNVG